MSRNTGSPRHGSSCFTPAPPPEPMLRSRDDQRGCDVPYYQNAQDFRGREYYDNYAFRNPDAYNDWQYGGQPPWTAPPSTMPRPRNDVYESYHAGPSRWTAPQTMPPFAPSQPSSRPFSTDNASGAGSYKPPHRRNEDVAAAPRFPSPSLANLVSPPAFRERRSATPSFVIPLPDQEYMEMSTPDIPTNDQRFLDEGSQKLLVLDLNGTLIYRNKGSGVSRASYPRPYLGNFLEYLLRPETASEADRRLNKWSVFVWSSAQPHNVRGMLESTFDPKHIEGLWAGDPSEPTEGQYVKGKVLGVWARDKMGLSAHEYANKTQTVKDLRKVVEHFDAVEGLTETHFRLQDILLLDDSPKKAVHQPWNQVVLPEYDRTAYQQSREAVARGRDGRPTRDCDESLLAIIGILEDLKSASNVPAWIRAGGLKKPDVYGDLDEWAAASGTWCGIADGPGAGQEPRLDQLPSHESFQHWCHDASVAARWIEKGKAALELYGIPLNHGINMDASATGTPAPTSPKPVLRGPSRHMSPGHTLPQQRSRAYSPSQPMLNDADGSELARATRSLSIEHDDQRPSLGTVADQTRPRQQRRPRSPAGNGQTRSFATVNPNPNIAFAPVSEAFDPSRPVDTWRTLRSADISRWLADFADRASIDEQARTLVRQTGDLLRSVGTDETWDRRMPPEILAIAGWHDGMTNEEIDSRGRLKAMHKTKEMVKRATENGMPVSPLWSRDGKKQLTQLEQAYKRSDTLPLDDKGQKIGIPKKIHAHINDTVLLGGTTDETLNFPSGTSLLEWERKAEQMSRKTNGNAQVPAQAPTNGSRTSGPTKPTAAAQDNGITTRSRTGPVQVQGDNGTATPDYELNNRPYSDASSASDFLDDDETDDHADDDNLDVITDDGQPEAEQYPTDYPSSALAQTRRLAVCRIDFRNVKPDELARFFARAAASSDKYQAQYLAEIRQKEQIIASRKLSDPRNFADLKRIERLRGWIVRAEVQRDRQNERARERRRVIREARARGEPTPPPPPRPPAIKRRDRDPEAQKRRKERSLATRRENGTLRPKKPKAKRKNQQPAPAGRPQHQGPPDLHQPRPPTETRASKKRKAAADAMETIHKMQKVEPGQQVHPHTQPYSHPIKTESKPFVG